MTTYRVTVVAERGGDDPYETLFEIAGSAALVQHIVPGVLDTVLAEPAAATERSVADRVFDSATAAGVAAEQQAAGPDGETAEQATKRKRRTKAEIVADKEAQGLGFRDAAHRAEAESTQAPHPGGPDPTVPYMAPDGPVVPTATSVLQQEPPVLQVTEAPAPYNPFAS